MLKPERPRYIIGEIGDKEVPIDDWALGLKTLGRLGIGAVAISPAEAEDLIANSEDLIEDGTIPYSLNDITSREQYLANEHLGEFWPEYRLNARKNRESISKYEALSWGINMLTNPGRRSALRPLSESQTELYAEELGLKIVSPRSLVRFSDKYSPNAYGLWNHPKYGNSVIEVGSFIDFVPKLVELPIQDRPSGVDMQPIKLFVALAAKLSNQINAA